MTTRALRGNGSVTRLKTGKWLLKFPVAKDGNGKTKYRSKTCATKSEARHWQNQFIALREQQALVAGPRQTLEKYATEILLNGSDHVADRTRDGYNLRTHVFPQIGTRPLTEIRPHDLEALFRQLRGTGTFFHCNHDEPLRENRAR
jgi:hypothetical protein